jgi:hypothetical protein
VDFAWPKKSHSMEYWIISTMMESNETLLPDFTARKKGTFVPFYIDHFYLSHWVNTSYLSRAGTSWLEQKCEIEEHQVYKISKLLAQKTLFSHAFSRVRTRAVSRVIHKVGIAFLYGSNASIFDLVQLLESSSFTKPSLSVLLLLGLWTRSQKSCFHQIYNADGQITSASYYLYIFWFYSLSIKYYINWQLRSSIQNDKTVFAFIR